MRTKYSVKTISILECGVAKPTRRIWKEDILSRLVAELDSTASKRLLSAYGTTAVAPFFGSSMFILLVVELTAVYETILKWAAWSHE